MSSMQSLENTILRLGDQSGIYSDEEEQAISAIYDKIDTDPDLQSWRKYMPKSIVIVVLRIYKMDVDVLYETVKSLSTVALKTYPDLLARINPTRLQSISNSKVFQILKRPVDEGPAVIIFRINRWIPCEANLEELVSVSTLYFLTAAKSSPKLQRQGFILICDVAGFRLRHARHLTTIDLLSKIATVLSAISTKMVKGVVVINSFAFFYHTFNMFKWVLPSRMKNIIQITKSDMSHITKLIPPERLPVELGGVVESMAYDETISKELFSDVNLIPTLSYLLNEVLITSGYRRRRRSSVK
ncbi:uncharacterized protein LOC110845628 isoform X2 [Folsomia candida]|uniref:Alpha-tocopherol transfer protein-like n=1 Tax=Folsomia candida TaxID=158441 RepID=A0A226EK95_FOLCA|nr:uncharacterized protein LOC110845628 isoform X2 [Folsomia candida]OXA57424.1 Alpha-tocopherol transfer protein-like [Folsomia candida]